MDRKPKHLTKERLTKTVRSAIKSIIDDSELVYQSPSTLQISLYQDGSRLTAGKKFTNIEQALSWLKHQKHKTFGLQTKANTE